MMIFVVIYNCSILDIKFNISHIVIKIYLETVFYIDSSFPVNLSTCIWICNLVKPFLISFFLFIKGINLFSIAILFFILLALLNNETDLNLPHPINLLPNWIWIMTNLSMLSHRLDYLMLGPRAGYRQIVVLILNC